MITLESVTKRFGTTTALDEVSLHVERGEIYGVVGTSGAGKSTLIRTVNALERPDEGAVTVAGQRITELDDAALRKARRHAGMVFQHFNLLAGRTVRGNVELALEIAGTERRRRAARADEVLELVGLTDRAEYYPSQLSGGQKQRVGIARALATQPEVLLLDEATSALDPETTRSILALLRRLRDELDLTVMLITHEMDVVRTVCDSATLLQHGRVVEQGHLADLVAAPGSPLTHDLFPLGPATPSDHPVLDLTFPGPIGSQPVITQLARRHDVDIAISAASAGAVGGTRAGRIRVELLGDDAGNAAVLADLHAQGVIVEHATDAPGTTPKEASA